MVNHYDYCTSVTSDCPVSGTLYGYLPNLSVNAFFAALFGLLLLLQLLIGTYTRTWTYLLAVGLGVFGEMTGYIGRLVMRNNPWANPGFETQICCLVLAPSFLAAGIYLTLKHVVLYCGPEYSRLKAKWYPWIFIGSDLGSIIVQAIGGGVAASANHGSVYNKPLLDAGDALIIAGIALQSVTMFVCGSLIFDFWMRRRKAIASAAAEKGDSNANATNTIDDSARRAAEAPRFHLFCWALGFATLTILIRCIYRLPEMAGGWGNPRMRNETEFLILDGMMIALASIALTVAHPGLLFPPMRKGRKEVVQQQQQVEGQRGRKGWFGRRKGKATATTVQAADASDTSGEKV